MAERPKIIDGLKRVLEVIEVTDFGWSVCLVGENQSEKLDMLMRDLKQKFSVDGSGKKITSGFSYWGVEPTLAWARACTDPHYPVMQQSIESFGTRWGVVLDALKSRMGAVPQHYVSLGPGTGHKDSAVLRTLRNGGGTALYFPVDMSSEMLRISVQEPVRHHHIVRSQVLPVQVDFAVEVNRRELRGLLDHIVGDEPVLFSLLGNTLANFDDDIALLRDITRDLLHPRDMLLLEVATADDLSESLASQAADEYRGSREFQEFITAALMCYTDLSIDLDSLVFEGLVEENKGLRIVVYYKNHGAENVLMTLADRSRVPLAPGDTIRLELTRKYWRRVISEQFSGAGLAELARTHTNASSGRGRPQFGLDLLLLRRIASGDEGWRGNGGHKIEDVYR